MSLWAKAASAEGPDFAYLVSHAGQRVNNWGGSQVGPNLKLPCHDFSRSINTLRTKIIMIRYFWKFESAFKSML